MGNYVDWVSNNKPTVGDAIPWKGDPGLHRHGVSRLNAAMLTLINCFLSLIVDDTLLLASNSFCLDSPEIMGQIGPWNCELKQSSTLKLLLAGHFITAIGKKTNKREGMVFLWKS